MNSSASQTGRQLNPRQNATIFSKMTFWYTKNLIKKGFQKDLEEEDLYENLPEYDTTILGDRIESEWNSLKHKKNSMMLVFWNMVGKIYILLGFSRSITIFLNVIRPFIIAKLVFYFTPGQQELSKVDAYLYSALLIFLHIVDVIYRQNYYFAAETLSIKFRTAICSLLYRKFLLLPTSHLHHISFGKITNLITRDVNLFSDFFFNFNEAWTGLLSTVIICYNMYMHIGLPALIAVVAFGIFIPFQVCIGIWISKLKIATSKKTDNRIEVLQEALHNIRTTKMYVWEQHLLQNIKKARKEEIDIALKMYSILFFTVATATIIYNVIFYLVLMTNVWLGQSMTAETVYFITGSFLAMAFNLITAIPYGTFFLSQICVALGRMQTLVKKMEVGIQYSLDGDASDKPKIVMKNGAIKLAEKIIFQNANFEISGGLSLVTGPVSSGKSILLLTILKECELSDGNLDIKGRISYSSQKPWLFPSTIRQNIIFGSNYDKKRYEDVIRVCALEYDLKRLENGDNTIVAERGINLSKGQQSRINLARAIYKESDIYLLDECLSSLDSVVARYIFENCVLKFLSKKLVLLVTHNTNLMSYATNILELGSNTIKLCGNNSPQVVDKPIYEKEVTNKIVHVDDVETDTNVTPKTKLIPLKSNKHNVYEEEKKTGSVSLQVYKKYVNLGGGFLSVLIIFISFTLTQMAVSYKDKLISEWANLEEYFLKPNKSALAKTLNFSHFELNEKRNELTYKYTGAIIALSCFTLIRACALFVFAKKVSINLHSKMLKSVLHASLQFFDRTFIGNIINRFSKDLITVDENIPFILLHLSAIIFETTGNLLLISMTNVRFLVPIVLLFISFIFLRYIYLKVGQPLKRLDASAKSPVIGYLNATVEGLTTIKAFGATTTVKKEFEKCHNLYNSASFCHLSCIKAFVFAVDIFISIFIAIVILQFVIFDKGVLPGDVGLAVSQVFVMGGVFFFALYKCVDLETQMTSVERAFEYTTLPSERKAGLKLKNWPTKGEIKYENVCLTIKDSKYYLLKNINVLVKPRETLGIVGRTGAGKSSMISALFRLHETTGKITVDGIDIKTLSLNFLRSSISVIPQDPVIFNSTVRDNIDPERKYEDEKIWNALETAKLKKFIPCLAVNIKALEFTCGQKQLFCLARILIKRNKILVLDEMTETVDEETEYLINNIIDRHFSECTVIKIAHKIRFVETCDKILVLESGEIAEFGSPQNLMRNKNGLFYNMVQTSGLESNFV